jgi:hypothetical protein
MMRKSVKVLAIVILMAIVLVGSYIVYGKTMKNSDIISVCLDGDLYRYDCHD